MSCVVSVAALLAARPCQWQCHGQRRDMMSASKDFIRSQRADLQSLIQWRFSDQRIIRAQQSKRGLAGLGMEERRQLSQQNKTIFRETPSIPRAPLQTEVRCTVAALFWAARLCGARYASGSMQLRGQDVNARSSNDASRESQSCTPLQCHVLKQASIATQLAGLYRESDVRRRPLRFCVAELRRSCVPAPLA